MSVFDVRFDVSKEEHSVRIISRLFVPAAVAAMAAFCLVPAAQAGPVVFTVDGGTAYEYLKTCSPAAPYPCGTYAQSVRLQVVAPYPPRSQPITLGFAVDALTATAGADYTVTSGTVVVPGGQYVTSIVIPLVVDGAAEGTETFRVRLTSSSIGGNISDTAIGASWNDGQIPSDCTLSKSDLVTTSLACTARPAAQHWRHVVTCAVVGGWGALRADGPTVTGSGTSTAVCTDVDAYKSSYFEVLP